MNGKETEILKGLGKYGGGSVGIITVIYLIVQALIAPLKTNMNLITTQITEINKKLNCLPMLSVKQKILWEKYKKEMAKRDNK